MEFIVEGGKRLYGTYRLKGAKNAVLPLMAASLLTDERVTLCDCPDITDVDSMQRILRLLGVRTERVKGNLTVEGGVSANEVSSVAAGEIRSSVFLLGPLLARLGSARVAYPGGCAIGRRPIDVHLGGLKAMGVEVSEERDYILCDAKNLRAADVTLKLPSVGATENLMMAAVLTKGCTHIRNAAREPEIVDLAEFLKKSGANIRGAGTSVIKIKGVEGLRGIAHTPVPDRIVAGTLLTAVAITGGEVTLLNVVPEHLLSLTSKLSKSSCQIRSFCDSMYISADGRPNSFCADTAPYPDFPTDMQAQAMAMAAYAKGESVIRETVFETRFKHAEELLKMGADITVNGDRAVIRGVPRLRGAEVTASDLRGGAALVLAALGAEGTSIIKEIRHVDRGYEAFEKTLCGLGADIIRTGL